MTVYEVTQPWSGPQRFPGPAVGMALGSASFTHGADSGTCKDPAWARIDLNADLMTRWTHVGALHNGLSVRASNETDSSAWKLFASANSANPPYLDVRYSPQGASYEVTDILLPTNSRAGSLTVRITNLGSTARTRGGGISFGYIVRQGGTVIRTAKGWTADVAPMQTGTFQAAIDPLPPGDYDVDLTMFTPDGQDFHVVYEVPYGAVKLTVRNTPPSVNLEQPGNGATVETLTPTLYAEGVDDDKWPGKGLTFKFRLCSDQDLTQDCQESDWTAQSWVPSPLSWSRTYYWGVKAYDTVDPSPQWVRLALTTRVPQPQITSHLAGSPDTVHGPGLDPGIGN